jgi:hypothetical protein
MVTGSQEHYMPSLEMLRKLLDEFVEKEALIEEELKVIDEQIVELESKLGTCQERLSTLGVDREKVLRMRQRYLEGLDVPEVELPAVAKPEAKPAAPAPVPPSVQTASGEVKLQSVKDVKASHTNLKPVVPDEERLHPDPPLPEPEPLMPEPVARAPIPPAPIPQAPVAQAAPPAQPAYQPEPQQSHASQPHDEDDGGDSKSISGISALLEGLRSRGDAAQEESVQQESVQQAPVQQAPVQQAPVQQAPAAPVQHHSPAPPINSPPPVHSLPQTPPPPVQQQPAPAPEQPQPVTSEDAPVDVESAEAKPDEEDSDTVKSINDALRSLFR